MLLFVTWPPGWQISFTKHDMTHKNTGNKFPEFPILGNNACLMADWHYQEKSNRHKSCGKYIRKEQVPFNQNVAWEE